MDERSDLVDPTEYGRRPTPGAWRVKFDTNGWSVTSEVGAVTGWGRVTQSQADARLIAAAPELLEVARWVANGMERDTLPWAVEGARKAVAKAEGRTDASTP